MTIIFIITFDDYLPVRSTSSIFEFELVIILSSVVAKATWSKNSINTKEKEKANGY